MNLNILYVGIGGFVGSILRYLTGLSVNRFFPNAWIPYGTFLVNVAGSLLIGMLIGLSEKNQMISPAMKLLLVTGFCGGFTTFSAFAQENVAMLQRSDYAGFIMYTLGSVSLCLLAVVVGLWLAR